MAIRKYEKTASVAKPTLSTGKQPLGRKSTATPIGWSFWSTFLRCPWEWWQKYEVGLTPRVIPRYFTLGAAYHKLHQGLTPTQVAALGPEFKDVIDEAMELYQARTAKTSPPLPKPEAVEQLFIVKEGPLAGIYSAQPDAIEKNGHELSIREFKTASSLRGSDANYYNVNGEVLGEMVASGIPRVTVDIIAKSKGHPVSQIQVHLTEQKRTAFETLIAGAFNYLVQHYHDVKSGDVPAPVAFPRNVDTCVRYGQKCQFYELCWGSKAAATNFQLNEENKRWQQHLLKQ